LRVYDLLELYTHNHKHGKKIDRWAADAWAVPSFEDHRHLMTSWCHIFKTKPHIATNIFIYIIKNDKKTLFSFLFEMKLQTEADAYSTVLWSTINKCLENIDKQTIVEWNESDCFLTLIKTISSHDCRHRRERQICEWAINQPQIKCPWNPDIVIHGIGYDVVRLKSASKPLKITLYTDRGNIDILFKNEDVRKDRMTMDIAYWIGKTTGLVSFVKYSVMPIDSKCGIIEMLPSVTTLYDVKHVYNTTLQNFILERNSSLTVAGLRERFVKSVSAACVLSYVLGVGDRHLENMLVTDDGELVHVDFSYILGDAPTAVSTEMRITPDILEALGGYESTTFIEFQELCMSVYSMIREKSSFWYCLLVYLSDASPRIGNFGGERFRIQQHVLERLCPGETDKEASMQIVEIVKRSSNETWSQYASDTAHRFAKNWGIFTLEL